ncbi:DUF2867 domain-containing protein [Stappia sp.]|uniref:DUF2867 domain-containing protein n=1 Tax=Stappia sp. TaxID=1870903 RepID=UPI003D105185
MPDTDPRALASAAMASAATIPGSGPPYLVAPESELAFLHARSVTLDRPVTALEGWNLIRSGPSPLLAAAMRVRDAISGSFGVAPISGFSGARRTSVAPGERLDFFLVEHASDTDLVLSVRDRHLDVMTWLSAQERTYRVTSSVKVHNLFGRLYMVPVALAHRMIVAADLRRLEKMTATG